VIPRVDSLHGNIVSTRPSLAVGKQIRVTLIWNYTMCSIYVFSQTVTWSYT
jgi:hypothetical protein